MPVIIKLLFDQMATKLAGTNGQGNGGIEATNKNSVASLNVIASTPSATSPSVYLDIDPGTNKRIRVYVDKGNGATLLGDIAIS